MKTSKSLAYLVFAIGMLGSLANAEVLVHPIYVKKLPDQAIVVKAKTFSIFPLGDFEKGDLFRVDVNVLNDVYKDLSVYVVDAANMALVRQGVPFSGQGQTRKVAPFRIDAKATVPGPHFLVFDNRYANIIDKKVVFRVQLAVRLSEEKVQAMKADLGLAYSGLKRMFQFKDFNIKVRPCGMSNAFSETATGDVTLCTEILDEMSEQKPAMGAIVLHELGHTLLNLWGLPNYGNEDDADQFATVILLKSGEKGKQALFQWINWYAKRDSRAEATNMLTRGDTHSLSVQRIRNIQATMTNAEDLIKRWNNILYPHMTVEALRSIIAAPGLHDDTTLAKKEISKR